MEEGEFVKWKQIVVGLISIMMIFTSVRGEVNENQRSNYQMLEQKMSRYKQGVLKITFYTSCLLAANA